MKLNKDNRMDLVKFQLLTKKIVDVVYFHNVKNGQLIVLQVVLEDGMILNITNSHAGMGFGWQ